MNQNTAKDIMPGSLQNSPMENRQGTSNAQNKSSSGNLIDHKHFAAGNSDGCGVRQNLNGSCDYGPAYGKDKQSSGIDEASQPNEKHMAVSDLIGMVPREVKNKSQAHSEKIASANPFIGVYSSSSDPVHVPSSRSSGTMGAIQREVGVVGVWRRTSESDHSVICTSGLGYSSCVPSSKRIAFSSRQTTTFKSSPPNPLASKTIFPIMCVRKSFAASQYDGKLHRQVKGCLKAKYPNMEWKPKSSQKPNADGARAATQSSQMQADALSSKLLQVNIPKSEHVIIPQHLQVPESERAGLMFGSFGTESSLKASKDTEKSSNGPSLSTSMSSPVGLVEDPVGGQSVPVDCQVRTYSSDNSASAAEPEVLLPVNNESLSPRDIGTYPYIGLIQSHAASCMLHEQPQSLKNYPCLADYSAYDSQVTFDIPFSKTLMEDNTQDQGFLSVYEDLSAHAANSGSFSSMSMVQQQQPFTQLYPQVHISHYPNFLPYQQFFSPLYVPQLLVPNYSNNSVHINPSNGSNYLMVTGGSPQATSSSMKYDASEFKPMQAGNLTARYGSYTNPGGYMVGAVRSTVGMEDLARINFIDNNVYVPNPQSDADTWIQTPRDLASLQPSQCYNLAGEAQAHPTYLPAGHAANLALNSATFPSAHLQYPGFYQPLQPGSVTGQQVLSGAAANSGIGIVPSATTQVGTYQQTQLGHLGWSNNF